MLQRKITTSFFFSTLYCYIIRYITNMSNPLKLNQLHAEMEKKQLPYVYSAWDCSKSNFHLLDRPINLNANDENYSSFSRQS